MLVYAVIANNISFFRWHVRTKENIARVRKDEAEAAEKERQERLRIENADKEARLNILKQKRKQALLESGFIETKEESSQPLESGAPEHINLFANFEHATTTTNREHDKEIKEKNEEYEKKIGYLTYLGQDTNEALKKKNWYEVLPESKFSQSSNLRDTYEKLVLKDEDGKPKPKEIDVKDGEVGWKAKQRLDPINKFKKNCTPVAENGFNSKKATDKHMHCKNKGKKKKRDKDEEKRTKLFKLREERLKREQREKLKAELFLSGLNEPLTKPQHSLKDSLKVKPKYNSQFNPELARQNYK